MEGRLGADNLHRHACRLRGRFRLQGERADRGGGGEPGGGVACVVGLVFQLREVSGCGLNADDQRW